MNRTNNPVKEGPIIRGHHIQHIDTLSILVVDGNVIVLTHTEYLLVITLLRQLEKFQNTSVTQEPTEIYVSFEHLQECAALNNRTLLSRHIYNAGSKLWQVGMSIARVDKYGYMIVFEVEGDSNRFLRQSTLRQERPPGGSQFFALAV